MILKHLKEQMQRQHLSVVWFSIQQAVVKEVIDKWKQHLMDNHFEHLL